MRFISKISIVLAAATAVCADLIVNNGCDVTVYMYQSNSQPNNTLATNQGADGKSATAPVTDPYELEAGEKDFPITYIANGQGTSIKISKEKLSEDDPSPILQYEYTVAEDGTIYWDLSNLDGSGPSTTGSPFQHDNVDATPSGEGAGSGTCQAIKCVKDKVCSAAYQKPDDTATNSCPAGTGPMTIDLCAPDDTINTRAVPFRG